MPKARKPDAEGEEMKTHGWVPSKVARSAQGWVEERSRTLGTTSTADPRLGTYRSFGRYPGKKRPWRKGKISRVLTPYRWYADTAPLREEKREVKDHLHV